MGIENNIWHFITHRGIAAVIACLAIYTLIKWTIAYYHYRWRVNKIKLLPGGPPGHWLFGNILEFPGPGENGLAFIRERLLMYPKLTYSFYGPINIGVIVSHPDPIKAILKTSEPKPRQFGGYFNSEPWLGEGLLIAGGKKWARNRRLLTPAFHFDILKPYILVNNGAADTLNEKILASKDGYIDVFDHISLTTLEIILKCAFSYTDDVQTLGDSHPYVKAVYQLAHAVLYRALRPWLYSNTMFYLSPTGRKFKKNCDYVHSVAEDVINRRKQTLENKEVGDRKAKNGRYLDFLDILLTAKDDNGVGLTDREIRNEVDTFLFEGHDTTASGISWTLYSLAQNPEWQMKCQEEIDEVLEGRDTDDILWEDLPKLKTLTICVREALRLHTPVPFIQRETTKDMYIDGYFIPANTMINIQLYNVLHNPAVWNEPMKYDPERFLSENAATMDNFAFVPFSAGPRNCIGQNFAMHEMKVIVARVLRKFHLDVDPARPAKHELMVVMKTENGMFIKATPRSNV